MKLKGTKSASNKQANPFGSNVSKPPRQTVGPGIGSNRTKLGFGNDQPGLYSDPDRGQGLSQTKNTVAKLGNQALGETPPRDGPFAFGAASVATNFPTGAIKKSSEGVRNWRQSTEPRIANPFKALAAANKKDGYK